MPDEWSPPRRRYSYGFTKNEAVSSGHIHSSHRRIASVTDDHTASDRRAAFIVMVRKKRRYQSHSCCRRTTGGIGLKAGLLCTRVIQTSATAQPRLLVDRDALEVLRSRGITHAVPQYLATTTRSLFGVKRPGTLVSDKGINFTTASVTCTGFVVLECAREQAATIYRVPSRSEAGWIRKQVPLCHTHTGSNFRGTPMTAGTLNSEGVPRGKAERGKSVAPGPLRFALSLPYPYQANFGGGNERMFVDEMNAVSLTSPSSPAGRPKIPSSTNLHRHCWPEVSRCFNLQA